MDSTQLKQDLERYQDISSCMSDWIWEVNNQGLYTFVGGNIKEILGYEPSELINKTPFDFMEKDEAEKIAFIFNNIVRNKLPIIDLENWNVTKNGRSVCLLTNAVPVIDNDGAMLGYRGIDKDITARKYNERILNENAHYIEHAKLANKKRELEYYKLAVDEHAIVSISDLMGTITYVNNKFIEVSGYSKEELIGKNHRVLNSGEHSKEFFENLWQIISSGKIWNGSIKNQKKDGEYYWLDVTITPSLDENGIPFQYIAIRTDITEKINAIKSAKKSNRAKSEFLSRMSHELRTPLNAILGFGQILLFDKNDLNEIQVKNINEITEAGQHLLYLINDVLDLAKIESGKIDVFIESVTVNALLQQCIALIDSQIQSYQLELIDNIGNEKITVKADYNKLKQVLLNLISNAIKYNRKKGSITLNSEKLSDGYIRISVTNTGLGLTTDDISKLFTSFERLGQPDAIEGAGIGLVICKSLLEAMSGRIGVYSTVGESTTFWVELPAA